MTAPDLPVTIDNIRTAAARISGFAVRTPLLENAQLNADVGGRVLLKAENLQRTGSFKFRGAFNAVSSLNDDARALGVLAWSSGNHAQAVAASAQIWQIPATIVMPGDAPALKIENTRSYGATVVFYDRRSNNREEMGQRLAAQSGATIIPPYEYVETIAGQGTAGLEVAQDLEGTGIVPDAALICCGGGGLSAGMSLAMQDTWPGLPVYAVEPAGFDDTRRSLERGERVTNAAASGSICDALMAPQPGKLTFSINRHVLAGGIAVTDEEVRAAMAYAFRVLKLVIEPGGAVTLAAVLNGHIDTKGKTLIAVISGGNVDADLFASALQAASA